MKQLKVKNIKDAVFGDFWKIYDYSFPDSEKRTVEHQQTAFENPLYNLVSYLEKGVMVGFAGYWDFDGYLYIEHLAVNRDVRGSGYGSKIIRGLQSLTDKTIVLEIDEVVDEVSEKRLHFYERLGFKRNPYPHKGHRYKDYGDVPEHEVLTCPKPISRECYEHFDNDLKNIVMKK